MKVPVTNSLGFIRDSYGEVCALITQVVEMPDGGDRTSSIIMSLPEFESMIAAYWQRKSAALAVDAVIGDKANAQTGDDIDTGGEG
jgi:hypothetical protein